MGRSDLLPAGVSYSVTLLFQALRTSCIAHYVSSFLAGVAILRFARFAVYSDCLMPPH